MAELDLGQAFGAALVAFSITVGSGCLGLEFSRRGRRTLLLDHLDWPRLVCFERYRLLVSVVIVIAAAAAAAVVVRRRTGSDRNLRLPGPVD